MKKFSHNKNYNPAKSSAQKCKVISKIYPYTKSLLYDTIFLDVVDNYFL